MRDILTKIILGLAFVLCLTPSIVSANSLKAENLQSEETIEATGKVIDGEGSGLPGVTIIVEGSTRGVTTDVDGSFKIEVKKTDMLHIAFLGMEDQILAPAKGMTIVMAEAANAMEGLTVVAFAAQKKESVIGSVTTVNPKELKIPSSNLTTAFAGRVAGLIAYQRSGEPGQDNADFFIRGVTTFGSAGRASPLILIDNIELSSDDLSRLNPDDIATFSVLKDATATALYGARGANGVILVTTKEGKEGKVSVSFRYEHSISTSLEGADVVDPISFMKLHNEAVSTRDPLAILPYMDSAIAAREKGLNPYAYPVVDWSDMLFNDITMNQRANLSLSGGGSVARYYVALSYARDNGILNQDSANSFNNNIKLDKYSIRSNVNVKLSKSTDLAIRVSGTFDDYQGPLTGGADMYGLAVKSNPVLFPAFYAPDAANIHQKHILFGNSGGAGDYMNPYAQMLKGFKESQSTVLVAQLELKQNLDMITEGLKFRVLGSTTRDSYFDLSRGYEPFYYNVNYYDKPNDTYILRALNAEGSDKGTDYLNYTPGSKKVSSSLYLESSLAYDRTFAEKHAVSGMLVYIARESLNGNADELEDALPGRNLGLAGRFTYGYNSKYFVEGNFGYNGSEKFSKDNRWGFFPSAGFGWIVSQEEFWKNSSFLSETFQMFKFKGTYGLVGNDNISDEERFFYISQVNLEDGGKTYQFGTDFDYFRSPTGVSISRYADDEIGWEISYKMNLGIEMKLFNSLDIQVDYFTERRTNILQARADIPTTVGLQAIPLANIGEAQGQGVEIALNYQKSITEDLWFSAMSTFTYSSSEFSVYEEPDYSTTDPWLSRIGSKLSQVRGLIAERLFIDEADISNSPTQTFGEYMPGDIKYKDINGDGVVDNKDFVPIGYPTTPEIIYGFGFSAGYKSIDFSCFFQGSARSSFWIDPKAVAPFVNSIDGNKFSGIGNNGVLDFIASDHWSEDNQNPLAGWPRLSNYEVTNNTQKSTWYMNNGNFLRLKSAEFGYTLPNSTLKKVGISNFRVYLSGTNLFNISSFDLWDPEMGGGGVFGYPLQRVYNIGVQLNF